MIAQVSDPAAVTSEGGDTPPQEPVQEPTESPEKGPVDELWATLSPESRVEVAKRLTPEELAQHPAYEEVLKRETQSLRDKAYQAQREKEDRQTREAAQKRTRQDAETAVRIAIEAGENTQAVLTRATTLAEQIAAVDIYPDMIRQDDEALEAAPYFDKLSEEQKQAIKEPGREWGQQRRHRYQVLAEAIYQVAAEEANKKLEIEKKRAEKVGFEAGKLQGHREAPGGIPPVVPTGVPGGGLTWESFNALPIEEKAKLSDAERRQIYKEHDRRLAGR
jgi:hypothetical protein